MWELAVILVLSGLWLTVHTANLLHHLDDHVFEQVDDAGTCAACNTVATEATPATPEVVSVPVCWDMAEDAFGTQTPPADGDTWSAVQPRAPPRLAL